MKWISVDKELPNEDDIVLCWEFHGEISLGLYCGVWMDYSSGWILDKSHVTHWAHIQGPHQNSKP